MQNQLIRQSICISSLQEAKAVKKSSKGRLYADVVVVARKEKDQYGNDITVYVSQTKEQQEANTPKHYCGQGKLYTFGGETANDQDFAALEANATPIPEKPADIVRDMPF